MSELMDLDSGAEKILAAIAEPGDEGEAGDDPVRAPSPATSADETAPQVASDGDEEGGEAPSTETVVDTEPQAPAIDPPPGLTSDEVERFKALPREAQEIVARRERDRTAELRRGQDEIAAEKRAIATERQRIAAEAARFAELATTVDPVIAEGQKTDWAALAKSDPVAYIERKAAFEQRVQQVQYAQAIREQHAAQARAQMLADEDAKLVAKIPEWSDPDKGRAEYKAVVDSMQKLYGFKPEEMAITDHRLVLVARDAKAYHDLKAKLAAAEAKRAAPAPATRVIKPGSTNTPQPSNGAALAKRLASARDDYERAAILAATL